MQSPPAALPPRGARPTSLALAARAPPLPPPAPPPAAADRVLKILAATWNVGNERPSRNFSPWIPTGGGDYDVIVVGSQECTFRERKGHGSMAALPLGGAASPSSPSSPRASSPRHDAAHGEDGDLLDTGFGGGGDDVDSDDAESDGGVDGFGVAEGGASPGHRAGGDDAAPRAPSSRRLGWLGGSSSNSSNSSSSRRPRRGASSKSVPTAPKVASDCRFFEMVKAHVGPGFVCVKSVLMWQIGLLVFVRAQHAPHVTAVESGSEATGLMGVTPNKGGCAVGLRLYGTPVCFVSAHLAAHMKHAVGRNISAAEIMTELRLGHYTRPYRQLDLDVAFKHIIWVGDLNYRLDLGLIEAAFEADAVLNRDDPERRAQVDALIQACDWETLFQADQLRDAVVHCRAFMGFSEAPIDFCPTFKVKRREVQCTHTTQRVSSWCDRVLYKSLPGLTSDLTCASYSAFPTLVTSDHKPVAATMFMRLRPEVPLLPSDTPRCRAPILRVTNLKGHGLLGLDRSGYSDPYCMFYSDPDGLVVASAPHATKHLPAPRRRDGRGGGGGGGGDGSHASGKRGSPSTVALRLGAGLRALSRSAALTKAQTKAIPRTAIRRQTLDPEWGASDIPEMHLRASHPSALSHTHLIIAVNDWDLDADDAMGQGVLPLGPVATSLDAIPFDIPVVKGGIQHGRLTGEVQILWGNVTRPEAAMTPARGGTTSVAAPAFAETRPALGAASSSASFVVSSPQAVGSVAKGLGLTADGEPSPLPLSPRRRAPRSAASRCAIM